MLTRGERVWERLRVRRWMKSNPTVTATAVVVGSIVAVVLVNHYAPSSVGGAAFIVSVVLMQTAGVLFRGRR